MAAAVGKYAANKMLKKHMKDYQSKKVDGGEDPFFAMIEDPKRPGKMKKVKKQIPAYIPEHDAMVLASVRKSAYRLDMCLFNLFGIRFGWEAVIGIVPAAGDAIGVLLALMVFRKCCSVEGGLDNTIKLRMMINIIIDFAVGLVPFIGDIADAAFKCNTKNLRLLEVALDKKYRPQSARPDERNMVGLDKSKRAQNRKSGIYHHQDPPPATVFEDFSDEEQDRRQFMREQDNSARVSQPRPVATTNAPPSGSTRQNQGGWFSGKKSGRQGRDVEPPTTNNMRQETGSIRP
ncbi:Hypothetical protein R9X50_00472500 [Acrodontium crateriforme]|uniref:PH domain-containing protein n=1 Tax=Acrodontium crateriforme TaxID=150365 RepID=A0AAQ3M8F2_9PEZI|nr:Hypothetical protein R9X50_00472500 [Acrodontium crateriforme]